MARPMQKKLNAKEQALYNRLMRDKRDNCEVRWHYNNVSDIIGKKTTKLNGEVEIVFERLPRDTEIPETRAQKMCRYLIAIYDSNEGERLPAQTRVVEVKNGTSVIAIEADAVKDFFQTQGKWPSHVYVKKVPNK